MLLPFQVQLTTVVCNDYNFIIVTLSNGFGGEAMQPSFEELKQELKKKSINLSHQRLKVLEYLAYNQCHPTADQIFIGLKEDIPTLSKTTVYNTLHVLTEAGLVRVITIEDKETRYDLRVVNHGHFKCESCGMIDDFHIDIDSYTPSELNNYKINIKNVYFRGICLQCLGSIEENENKNR